jgi:hypothetical protein
MEETAVTEESYYYCIQKLSQFNEGIEGELEA